MKIKKEMILRRVGSDVIMIPVGSALLEHNGMFMLSEVSQVALVVKHPPANTGGAGDAGSNSGSGRSPGEENGKYSSVFLPGESHGQRSLAGLAHTHTTINGLPWTQLK